MSDQTSQQIEERIAGVKQESETFIGKLEADLKLARDQRFTDDHQAELNKQIRSARTTYAGILEAMEKELTEARTREIQGAAAKQQQQERRAQEEKEQLYQQLRNTWLAQHGDPQLFDEMFPQLYKEAMAKRTLEASQPDQDPGRRATQNAIAKAF